jgi:uncharacterized lipoprotein YddW (UPF0748 family)
MKKVRGVWLTTAASHVLNTKENIVDAMKLLKDTGFNTVFPVVWNNGYTLYPSNVLEQNFGVSIQPGLEERDILQEVLDAALPEIDVIPWFEYGFAASHGDDVGHILKKNPMWAGKDKKGKVLVKGEFTWMNSLDLEVQDFLLSLVLEVVENYPGIAGIQGDDRLPAMPSEGGYDKGTKTLYRAQFDKDPPLDHKDSQWIKWRANILTDFLSRLYREVKASNPNLIVSMSPSIYPYGLNEYLQDFPSWIRLGIVDFLHPQLYRKNLTDYQALVDDLVERVGSEKASILSPGILTRKNADNFQIEPEDLWKSIIHNRRSGCRGESMFFFESLRVNNNALANFLKKKDYANFIFIQKGDVGDDVLEIQQLLKSKGFYGGKIDRDFGSATKLAVEKFQEGLFPKSEVDGVVGPKTYAKLIS